jgi:hypothetical protein
MVETVIASEAKQSINRKEDGLLRRFAPRNDGNLQVGFLGVSPWR